MSALTHPDFGVEAYLRDLATFSKLTVEQEIQVATQARAGNAIARDLLIRSGLRVAAKLAKQAHRRSPQADLGDLIQEANLGVVAAADTFRPSLGFRFSTHAKFHIKTTIRGYFARGVGNNLSMGHGSKRLLKQYDIARDALRQQVGREPSFDEVCDSLQIAGQTRREMAAKLAAHDVVRFGIPTGPRGTDEDSATRIEDFLPDVNSGPAECVEQAELCEKILELLNRLDDRYAEVVRMRYGIGYERAYIRREIAAECELSEATVKAIESTVKRRLADCLSAA